MFGKMLSDALLYAVVLAAAPPAAQAGRNPSVTGGGELEFNTGDPTSVGTFGFAAIQQQDGTAVGNAELSYDLGDRSYRFHAEIDCVAFSTTFPDLAVVSGIVTQAEGPDGAEFYKGQRIVFAVADGDFFLSKANPDFMTYPSFWGPDFDCHTVDPFALDYAFVVKHGNIQVRPQ